MEYKESLLSSLYALKVNKLRTFLTMLGIVIGISSVILIVSVGQGAVTFVTKELSTFGTNFFSINPGGDMMSAAVGGSKTLTLEDVDAIKNDSSLTNIEYVAPIGMSTCKISANDEDKSLLVYGITEEMYQILKPNMVYGDFVSEDNNLAAEKVAVIGTEVQKTFFGENSDPVGESIKINNINYKVIGVAQSSSGVFGGYFNNALFIPMNVLFDEIMGEKYIQEIDVSVKDTDTINQTIEDVSILLRDRHSLKEGEDDDFIVQSFKDMLSTVQTITNLLTMMVAAISGISLVVGGVGVMNIMLVSVTERTKEVGLLKAIGAKDRDILKQFLIEAITMTFVGGVIGITFGVLGALAISLLIGIPFVVNIFSIIAAVGVSMFVGIVFGIYPAKRAANLSPIDALRYE